MFRKKKKPAKKVKTKVIQAKKPVKKLVLKEASYGLVKYLGNFETARMTLTYSANGQVTEEEAFFKAHEEIEKAFDRLHPNYKHIKPDIVGNEDNYMREMILKEQEEKKRLLKENYDENKKLIVKIDTDFFHTLKKRISNGSVSIEKAKEFYSISDEVEKELLKK